MAAILPHLEQEYETTPDERRYWQCVTEAQEQGMSLGEYRPDCPTPDAIIDQAHAQLLQVAWTRRIIVEQLQGKTIRPFYDGRDIFLHLEGDPVEGPMWNPMTDIERTNLLSWTTKMAAPSFSLAAGSKAMGGSCPGATAGQSLVPNQVRERAAVPLIKVLKLRPVKMSFAICEFCYAEHGQYAAASVQYHQLLRRAWVKRALREDIRGKTTRPGDPSSAFVQLMIEAIEEAKYLRDGGRVDDKEVLPEPEQWRDWRFFRIHDSGDFFEPEYLVGWKNIANHFHPRNYQGPHQPIRFWAPTRIWAQGRDMVRFVDKVNTPVQGEQSNLILRPSAYHIDQRGPGENQGRSPLGPGWAAPTVVLRHETVEEGKKREVYDWPCEAYAVQDGPNCRKANGPDPRGVTQPGCRNCWMHPTSRVNYTLH